MRAAAIPVLLLLGACNAEPDFDTRYDKAAKEIEARAKAMDADIAQADRANAVSGDLQDEAESARAPASSGE